MANVIQFMHSGVEIDVNALTGYNGWNATGKHGRRLIRHSGEYVNTQNQVVNGDLAFWNEYEAPTNATPITGCSQGWEYAQNYHTIVRPIPAPPPLTQVGCCVNTDPCVFGSTFKYSNCRQVPRGGLRGLPAGSLILFGARHKSSHGIYLFALDTVFVVEAAGIPYTVPVGNVLPFVVSNEYRRITLDNLQSRPGRNGLPISNFEFYRGAVPHCTNGNQISASTIFSYTPAKIFGTQNYNERCMLDLSQLNTFMQNNNIVGRRSFSPGKTDGHSSIIVNGSNQNVQLIWKEVRRIVQKVNGFELGVHFPW